MYLLRGMTRLGSSRVRRWRVTFGFDPRSRRAHHSRGIQMGSKVAHLSDQGSNLGSPPVQRLRLLTSVGVLVTAIVRLTVMILLGAGLVLGSNQSASAARVDHTVGKSVAERVDCGRWRNAVATFGGWSRPYQSDCAVIGGSPSYRKGYAWAIQAGTNTRICVQARGYVVEDHHVYPRWFGMGCGTAGSGTVPWGQGAGIPAVRAKIQPGFLGGLYRWRH